MVQQHDPFVRLCEGVLRFRKSLSEDAVLVPVNSPQDLPMSGVDLVATDSFRARARVARITRDGARKWAPDLEAQHSSFPAIEVVPDSSRYFSASRGAWSPNRSAVVLEESQGPALVALTLAPLLIPSFPSEFVRILPQQLTPDERLGLAYVVLEAAAAETSVTDLAPRCACGSTRLRQDLIRAGVGSVSEIRNATRVWHVLQRCEAGACLSDAARDIGFASVPSFSTICSLLTGLLPEALMQQPAPSQFALSRFSKRWSAQRAALVSIKKKDGESEVSGIPADSISRFTEFRKRFWSVTLAGAKSRGATREQAEDAALHIFTKLWAAGPERWTGSFNSAFFFQAGKNEAANLISKVDERHAVLSSTPEKCFALTDIPEMGLGSFELVHRLVSSLPEPRRATLRLCDLEGWTPQEVAELMGTTANAVKLRRHRAKMNLKTLVGARPN
jgi:DNA-directed RNA polymerase specialized sigma24 family protein